MMETVRIALHTPLSGFANDLCDVLKLFYAVDGFVVNPEANDEAEALLHVYSECDGKAVCTFTFRGRAIPPMRFYPIKRHMRSNPSTLRLPKSV